jgi:hypothetical protein
MLQRIPFWGWFVITLVWCYLLVNPTGFSLLDLWLGTGTINDPILWLLTLIVTVPLFLFVWHTLKTFSFFGFLLYFVIVGVSIWALTLLVLPGQLLDTVGYWGQWVAAALLTLGLRFGKIRRDITSTVPVDEQEE